MLGKTADACHGTRWRCKRIAFVSSKYVSKHARLAFDSSSDDLIQITLYSKCKFKIKKKLYWILNMKAIKSKIIDQLSFGIHTCSDN